MGLIKEFKDFAMKGNVVDMAVGIIIGGAFGKIISSLVENVIMPAVGMLGGSPDFSGITAGPIRIGSFIQTIVDFLIIAAAIFLMVKLMNKAQEATLGKEEKAAPAAPPEDIVLLREIRDSLRKK